MPRALARAENWPAPNADLGGTRNARSSSIDATNVGTLTRRWRFHVPEQTTYSGLLAATTIVVESTAYVQTLNSNVYALDLDTGDVRWRRLFRRASGGPNGLAAADGRLFGNTDAETFALDASTGRVLWRQRITTTARPIDVAPAVAGGLVVTGTIALRAGTKGEIFVLDAQDGRVRWRFTTVRDPWANPRVASGGGIWWTPTIDSADGTIFVGTANPLPWGGTAEEPNGASYRGDVLYTDSLLALHASTGELEWYDQVTPHDVRDYDFALPPILVDGGGDGERDLVVGGGKAGRVIAWDRNTNERVWEARVGRHENDTGLLPREHVTVCPGLFGGVLTPMAYARKTVFVPVVDLCMRGSAIGYESFQAVDFTQGTGELVALDVEDGDVRWRRSLPSPAFGCATTANDIVVTATFDGTVYVLRADDGRILRRLEHPAGINACPTIAGDVLLVPAGAEPPGIVTPTHVVDAYALPVATRVQSLGE